MTEAEIGVIGCVLIDNDSMYKVYNKLKPEMFSTVSYTHLTLPTNSLV